MNKQFKLWSIVIVFVLGSFASGAYAQTFNVRANQHSIDGGNGSGLDTGISVEPGQLLVISANKNDTWRLGPGPRESNANGLGNPFGQDFGNYELTPFTFLHGALVGSLDDGETFFPIGTLTEQSIITDNAATLRLYAWDSNKADNSGSITVDVEVYSGPE